MAERGRAQRESDPLTSFPKLTTTTCCATLAATAALSTTLCTAGPRAIMSFGLARSPYTFQVSDCVS